MAPSWFQILIVIVLLVLLFGRGKISELMGDVAKGIKSFKKGIAEDDADADVDVDAPDTVKTIEHDKAKTNINKTVKSSRGSKAKAS
ncbi:MAG: twin-arginine translocase TatA/TatE family subunit [Proteobacteria bacterium]|nr:twin-arginine translocase TatA/TatE family subunit [Pseudomonadota bacterium]